MKYIIILIFALFTTSSTFSQKFAIIEQNKILKAIDGYEQNLMRIDSLRKQYTLEVEKAQNDLDIKLKTIFVAYQVKENETIDQIKQRLSKEDNAKLDLFIKENELIQMRAKNYDNYLQLEFKEKIQPKINKLNDIINNYAKKNKLDMIYIYENIVNALAYIDDSKIVTQDIINLLK